MKKVFSLGILLLVLSFSLVGCTKEENSTYYPSNSEMQRNLEQSGYEVLVENDSNEDYIGTHLYAIKKDEYIEFYRLDDGRLIDDISKKLESQYNNCEKFVSMKDDNKYGSLVFCGTKTAVADSGIKIVDVKIK